MDNISGQSWLHPSLELGKSVIDGTGVFTTAPITAGDIVIRWGGQVMSTDDFRAGRGRVHSNVGIGEGLVLAVPPGEDLGVDDYMNHSCDPNLWLSDATTLVARRNIETGEELTIDYAIEVGDCTYVMRQVCNCGSELCRRIVTGWDWRLPTVQRINADHMSPFITKRIQQMANGNRLERRMYTLALVTGASRGIGRAITQALLAEGLGVVAVARNPEGLRAIAEELSAEHGGRLYCRSCDLANVDDIDAMVEFCRQNSLHPDVLVLNAGIFREGSLGASRDEDFMETMAVNLTANYRLVKAFVGTNEMEGGRIVIVGSTAGYEAYPLGPMYGVAKWGLRGYAINLRKELASRGIGVTYLAPGGTLTDLWAGEDLPEGRLLDVSDIGKIVCCILRLSRQAVVEELIVRPMQGDIHE